MKAKLVYALAGALALGFATVSYAEDKPDAKPEGGRPQRGNFSPEQREKAAKELGLNPDEMKNLSREERMAKFKEAVEKKTAELEKKKADGTITEAEKDTLKRLEERKKWAGQGGAGGGADAGKTREEMKAKFEELKKKAADGTITDAEKETLKRMEEHRKTMQNRGDHGPDHKGGEEKKGGDDKK